MKLTRERLKQIIKEELQKLGVSGNTSYIFGYNYLRAEAPELAKQIFDEKKTKLEPDIGVGEIWKQPAITIFKGGTFQQVEPQDHVALQVPIDSPTNATLKKLSDAQHGWWETKVPKGAVLQRVGR